MFNIAPDKASKEPLVSDFKIRFIDGLTPSLAFAKIFSIFTTLFWASLLSRILFALFSDNAFAAFSSLTTINSSPAEGGNSKPEIKTGDDGIACLIKSSLKSFKALIFLD